MRRGPFFLAAPALLAFPFLLAALGSWGSVRVAPAPAGEPLSTLFQVRAEGKNVPVYVARISSLSAEQRRSVGTLAAMETDQAAFASFDMTGHVRVSVTCPEAVRNAKILPASYGVAPAISGNRITFTVTRPGQLTLEVNGNWINSLHLFANPPETDVPRPGDPNVIYYGPGLHEVNSVTVTSGQTVYIADGAVVYGKVDAGSPDGPIFLLQGSHIVLRGHGIIDGSRCPWHSRSIMGVHGTDIRVEGVVLRDSSSWTMPVLQSEQVRIANLKIFGWRGNSDGIDICNCRHVEVSDCFLRTFDDLVVLKANEGQGEVRDVRVTGCVLWNELAHALSLGAELREPLSDIVFSDCDVIHDKGREWLLRVFNCDSARVKNVVFENIRIEEARRLMSLWIGATIWSRQPERGHIEDISFRNITSTAPEVPGPWAELIGFDAGHAIDGVEFRHVVVGDKTLGAANVNQNAFVHGVVIRP